MDRDAKPGYGSSSQASGSAELPTTLFAQFGTPAAVLAAAATCRELRAMLTIQDDTTCNPRYIEEVQRDGMEIGWRRNVSEWLLAVSCGLWGEFCFSLSRFVQGGLTPPTGASMSRGAHSPRGDQHVTP